MTEKNKYKSFTVKFLAITIIMLLMFVILTIFKMTYILLISVIVGVTNIIPFFAGIFSSTLKDLIKQDYFMLFLLGLSRKIIKISAYT